jgi:hydrogenase 3 maturation protease
MDKELEQQLNGFMGNNVCLLGIGNRHLHDEGVGSIVAEALQSFPEINVIDAGLSPENYLEAVAGHHPDTILLVDAVDFGGDPGEVRLIYPEKVSYSAAAHHAGSLRMLAEYLQVRTYARIALLAIQPVDTSDGEELSPSVSDTVSDLLAVLPAICGKHTHGGQPVG